MSLFSILMLGSLLSSPGAAGPLSERILFVAPYRGLDKLFICRIDGRDLVRLSRVKGHQFDPAYSAALERVFFVRLADGREQICSVDLNGQDLQVHVSGVFNASQPDVHPGGKRLVFSTDLWGPRELAELDLETGDRRRLTYGAAISTYPRYSPAGDRIAFLSRRHGQSELYLLDVDTGQETRLTVSPFEEGPPNWKPDGQRLIATRIVPPGRRARLLELDLPTNEERILLHKAESPKSPDYSSDGARIIFIKDDELLTFDTSDTAAQPFPLRAELAPQTVRWITIPLP